MYYTPVVILRCYFNTQCCSSNTFGCYLNTLWCYIETVVCNFNTWWVWSSMGYYLDSLITRYKSCKEYKLLPQGWSLEQRSMTMYLRFYVNYTGFQLDTGFSLQILSLVFLCINDSYLQELLVQNCPSRNLKSQSKSCLVSPIGKILSVLWCKIFSIIGSWTVELTFLTR